jgi:hypothetical protein
MGLVLRRPPRCNEGAAVLPGPFWGHESAVSDRGQFRPGWPRLVVDWRGWRRNRARARWRPVERRALAASREALDRQLADGFRQWPPALTKTCTAAGWERTRAREFQEVTGVAPPGRNGCEGWSGRVARMAILRPPRRIFNHGRAAFVGAGGHWRHLAGQWLVRGLVRTRKRTKEV